MLLIRDEQMKRFKDAMETDFLRRVEAVLRREFPVEMEHLGVGQQRDFIRQGRKTAEAYGIVTEWGICRFLLYQLRLGSDFDVRPDMPWASRILNDAVADKMNRLDNYYFRGR